MNVAAVIPGVPAWSAGSSQPQGSFTLPGNCQVRDEFGARVWRLAQGSRRWGQHMRGEYGAPGGSLLVPPSRGAAGAICWQHCHSREHP